MRDIQAIALPLYAAPPSFDDLLINTRVLIPRVNAVTPRATLIAGRTIHIKSSFIGLKKNMIVMIKNTNDKTVRIIDFRAKGWVRFTFSDMRSSLLEV
jgi:hypothetical protein